MSEMHTIRILAKAQLTLERTMLPLLTATEYTCMLDRIESLHLAVLTLEDAKFSHVADEVRVLIAGQADELARRLADLAHSTDNYHAEHIWQSLGKYVYQGKSIEKLRDLGYYIAKLESAREVEAPEPA